MKNLTSLFYLLLAIAPCIGQSDLLTDIEAVEYDPASGRFFISNNSSIVQKMPDGSYELFGSAQASHGMELMSGVLFVIKGSQVRGYDLQTAEQVMSFAVPGAMFLNGMASNGAGLIWITDFTAKKIHQIDVSDLQNPTMITIVENTVSVPNGIVHDAQNNRLLFVNWNSNAAIKAVSLETNEVTIAHGTSLQNLDGIDLDALGRIYVSSWSPTRITRYSADFGITESVVTTGLSSPADICFAGEIDTLAVPNSGSNEVQYFGFSATDVHENERTGIDAVLYPNPANDMCSIRLHAQAGETVEILIADLSGKAVAFYGESFPAAQQSTFFFPVHDLPSGAYFVSVSGSAGSKASLPLTVVHP